MPGSVKINTAILLLAAGHSRRFRQATGEHKLLAMVNGRPVLQHTLDQAAATGLPVFVVTRPEDHRIHALLAGVTPVFCHSDGIGHSIAAGVEACDNYDGVLISLGDLPWLTTASYLAVSEALEQHPVVRAVVADKPGHPVGFRQRFYPELLTLQGDVGAQMLMQTNLPQPVFLTDRGCLLDVDRPDDLLMRDKK
ncbi:MAG: nucleotidyltransferase family protein [Erwinia billingiae]